MKRIEAIVKDENLDAVKKALDEAGFFGMSLFALKGRGAEGGIMLEWRAGGYRVDFLHRAMLMIVVPDEACDKALKAIQLSCPSGMVFVSPVEKVIRLDSGQRNNEALC